MESQKNCELQYSVLMSVYHKEKPEFLQQAIDSMWHQTLPPTQIVLVEDGPLTDELYAVLDAFSKEYGEAFCRIANETNLGLGPALQKGLQACTCDWIARMDTDDISKPDRCEKQIRFLQEHGDVDIVGTNIEEFIGDTANIVGVRQVPTSHDDICIFMKQRCPMNHVSVLFKKESVLAAGGYQKWHFNEDYYLWVRMYLAGAKFANLDESLVSVRVGEEMYARRGGKAYYNSEKALFKFMYEHKIISHHEYVKAKTVRFIVQRMMTNKTRQWFFKKFARG